MKVQVTTHYSEDDEDFLADYCHIEIFIDDRMVEEFYHNEDGTARSLGYVAAIKYLRPDAEVKYVNIADWEV